MALGGARRPSVVVGLTVGAIAVFSFVLGYIGLRQYMPELEHRAGVPSFSSGALDLLYYDLQLFVVNSLPVSYGGPYPPALEIARFGAPITTVYALLATLALLLDAHLHRLRVRLARGHVVVCGGGAAAVLLGYRLRRSGRVVVVVDGDVSAAAVRAAGLLHVAGDPREDHVLRRAGPGRAAEVFILHSDSAASAATVLAAARLAGSDGSPTCYAAIADREVHAGLLARYLGSADRPRLRLHLFNLDELAAHALLDVEAAPAGARGGHVVIIGLGGLGQALLVELARRRRFASPGAELLLVTVADAGAPAVVARLQRQAPFLAQACQVKARSVPACHLDEAALAALLADGPPPDRVYVCCEEEATALRVGLQALRARHRDPVRVVVCVEQGSAFTAAFHGEDRLFDDALGTLRVLAVLELRLSPELIRAGVIGEQLARELHASYVEACEARGEQMGSRPALVLWEELPDELKESNRSQARQLGEKLDAIDCVIVPHFDPPLTFAYRDEDEVMLLTRMEHERWLGERRGLGFVHGRLREGRAHPDLVGWEDLSEEARAKDAMFVRNLPRILADSGLQVLRLPKRAR